MVSIKEIDALLPQTQCGDCGYAGCLPYAEAIASGTTSLNRCLPGGVDTLRALGDLLSIDTKNDTIDAKKPSLAIIREAECIGCTKCIQACPVDAIIGSAKLMHYILEHECTGCGLCIEPCPVNCIELLPVKEATYNKITAKGRFHARKIRVLHDEQEKQQSYRANRQLTEETNHKQEILAKQEYIKQAMARKAKRSD